MWPPVRDQGAFGNFRFEAMRRKPGVAQDGKDCVGESPVAELRRREIERQRSGIRPGRGFAAGVSEQLTRHDVHQADLFGKRDKDIRRYQAAHRMMPPTQAFKTDDPIRLQVNDGLIVRA